MFSRRKQKIHRERFGTGFKTRFTGMEQLVIAVGNLQGQG